MAEPIPVPISVRALQAERKLRKLYAARIGRVEVFKAWGANPWVVKVKGDVFPRARYATWREAMDYALRSTR